MDWNVIKTQNDIDMLMLVFGGFHDSCLKELCFSTGTYVNSDLSMSMINKTCAKIIFQRQARSPSAIEIEFNDVIKINIIPAGKSYTTEILDATIFIADNIFYWADNENWSLESSNKNNCTWIGAKQVKWRERDDFIGEKKIYLE